MKNPIIKPTSIDDIAGLQTVLDGTELFPSEMLPDMLALPWQVIQKPFG